MSDVLSSRAEGNVAQEELMQLLYQSPVGIVKFRLDGTVDILNPVAARLLIPVAPRADLSNLYEAMSAVVPELSAMVEDYRPSTGTILDGMRFTVGKGGNGTGGGNARSFALTVSKISATLLVAVIQDVTMSAEQERRLFDDQQRFHAVFDHVRDHSICAIDNGGLVEEWNPSLSRSDGWAAEDIVGRHVGMFHPTEEGEAEAIETLLEEARRVGSVEIKGWRIRKDGSRYWGNTVITARSDAEGRVQGFVVIAQDLTERERVEGELLRLATTDPLTGAFNRRYGQTCIEKEHQRRQRYGNEFALMFMDVDNFKAVNDHYGHTAGDTVLCALVRLCEESLRNVDVVIRWGGEEFLVLLPETDLGDAERLAQRLRRKISEFLFETSAADVQITVSIGVAGPRASSESYDEIVMRADEALYDAKAAGRNRVMTK